ncbi:protein Hook homolog 1-like [Salarias fasciatus]|uniref:protein Hook homolog 1-like n=1 Tax=Salarias fasciatus TaxID=181472 RepID=UPI0011765539|nr:protein Hook homolog 1-like [Salarias fasciatus]
MIFDNAMSLDHHLRQLVRNRFFQLHNYTKLRPTVSKNKLEMIIYVLMSLRLDYCNSLFTCLNKKELAHLQGVQNSAFKILVLTFRALQSQAPMYIGDWVKPYGSARSRGSSEHNLLRVPRTRMLVKYCCCRCSEEQCGQSRRKCVVVVLQEERNSLLAEKDVLADRANQLDTFDDPSTPSGRKHSQLQQQLETLQEENFRNCSDRVVMLEASMETYKRKLENLGDLKRQMKLLEENNTLYMQNTESLEKELRKANAARTQLETYKRQAGELHKKLSEETRRVDHLVFEMKRLEEKHETIIKEKERIIVERDSLKEMNEELRCTQAQQHQLSQAGMQPSESDSHDNLAAELVPIQYREKFINLQYENKMLRVQQKEHEQEKIAALQAQLEESHKSCSELDTENRLGREQISELQQQVEDLQKALQSQAAKPDDSNLKRKLDAHMVQLNEAQDEIMKKKELLEDLQPDNTQTSLKVDELMAALKKKDDDMRAMEERYKMYLEKARNVIRALDPKLNPATAEIQALRIQLADRDAQILNLERQCEQARLRESEEKLIVTAWYNKSLSFQKLAMESRLGGCAASTSFLSQQHRVSNAARQALPTTCLTPLPPNRSHDPHI